MLTDEPFAWLRDLTANSKRLPDAASLELAKERNEIGAVSQMEKERQG